MDDQPPPPGTNVDVPPMPQLVRLSGANLQHETTPFGYLAEVAEQLETANPLPQEPALARLRQEHPLRSYTIQELQSNLAVVTPWNHLEVIFLAAQAV